MEHHDGDTIRLSIPATADAVKIARVGAAGLGTRLGFGFSEVEELRLAVGEAAALLTSDARDDNVLWVTYLIQADGLRITLALDASAGDEIGDDTVPPAPKVPMLTMSVLDEVVDEWQVDPSGTAIHIYKVPADRARLPAGHPPED